MFPLVSFLRFICKRISFFFGAFTDSICNVSPSSHPPHSVSPSSWDSSAPLESVDETLPEFDEERFLLEYRDILPSFLQDSFGKGSYDQLSSAEKSILVREPDLPLQYARNVGERTMERLARFFPDETQVLYDYFQRMVDTQPHNPQSQYIPYRRIGKALVIDFGVMAFRWKLDETSLLSFVRHLRIYELLQSSLQFEDPEWPSRWLRFQCVLRLWGWTFEVRDSFISTPLLGPFQGRVEYHIHHAFWLPCRVADRRSPSFPDIPQNNLRYLSDFLDGSRKFDDLLYRSILELVGQLRSSGIHVDVAFYCPRSGQGMNCSETHFTCLKKGLADLDISVFDSINEYLKDAERHLGASVPCCLSTPIILDEEKKRDGVPLLADRHLTLVVGLSWTNSDLHQICKAILHRLAQRPPWLFFLSFCKLLDRNEVGFLRSQCQRVRSFAELTEDLHSVEGMLRNGVSFWEKVQEVPCFSLFPYLPITDPAESTSENWEVRTLIWDFKANPQHDEPLWLTLKKNRKASDRVVQPLARVLSACFQRCLSKLTLVCAPASSQAVQERRYRYFSNLLCKQTGMTDAYPFIRVVVDGEAKHAGGKAKAELCFDRHFFRGRYVLLFDDVITKGTTMHELKVELESLGAVVIGGCSIGRTRHSQCSASWVDLLLH